MVDVANASQPSNRPNATVYSVAPVATRWWVFTQITGSVVENDSDGAATEKSVIHASINEKDIPTREERTVT